MEIQKVLGRNETDILKEYETLIKEKQNWQLVSLFIMINGIFIFEKRGEILIH